MRFMVALFGIICGLPALAAEEPPRHVRDLVALIETVKPDPQRIAQLRAELDKPAPAGNDPRELIVYLRTRSKAAEELGLASVELDARRRTYEAARGSGEEARHLADLAGRELSTGNYLEGVRLTEELLRIAPGPGFRINGNGRLAVDRTRDGRMAEADELMKKAEGAYTEALSTRNANWYRSLWTSLIELQRANYQQQRGKLPEAELSYRKAIEASRDDLKGSEQRARVLGTNAPPAETSYLALENAESALTRNLIYQGRAAEAELISREQIKRVLMRVGRDSPYFSNALSGLAAVMVDQGRFADAEALAREAVAILERTGAEPASLTAGNAREVYAQALFARGDYAGTAAQLDRWTIPLSRKNRTAAIYLIAGAKTGSLRGGAATAEEVLRSFEARLGPNRGATGAVRGAYAMLLRKQGEQRAALEQFRQSFRTMAVARATFGEASGNALGNIVFGLVAEEYMSLLSEMTGPEFGSLFPSNPAAAEAFVVADAVRAGSVQKALALAAARASADPQLAAVVRREQDMAQEMEALYNFLARLTATAVERQLPRVAEEMRTRVEALRREHAALLDDIDKRFPAYGNLINPRPPSLAAARQVLREGEALLAIVTGERSTFIWAVQKNGPLAFHAVAAGREQLLRETAGIRRSVDPFSHGLPGVPQFDLKGAYDLYARYIAPVAGTLTGARHVIVAANGPLAAVPLGLLPTAPPVAADDRAGLEFAGYRSVPWLIRSHALTQVPSINALVTLRNLPRRNGSNLSFAGYGDPYFSRAQAAGAAPQNQVTVRGVRVALRNAPRADDANSVELASLPRLPDTADEIRDIAGLLKANPADSVFLQDKASEQDVKTRDLSKRGIVMFATHGLVPGDLNGLTQPALALSAPEVTGGQGDGLLTMEEILGLKLDADWVVLSACNTASGDGAGAEAVSGLGRAFFYAGTRSLLVSNWPVETVSAKLLTTGIFRRQAADPGLGRALALQQTMLDLIDQGVARLPDGKPAFSYAHPLFWAPFSLIGDGG